MALFHRATVTPTKAEMIGAWIPMQAWGPDPGVGVEPVGSFRFDDPEGRVGLETHLVRAGDALFQIPLTYRDEPMVDDAGLIGEMEHSALGTRWVYDGLRDPRYLMMLAAVAMTGQGEAIGLVELDGRWQTSPSLVISRPRSCCLPTIRIASSCGRFKVTRPRGKAPKWD